MIEWYGHVLNTPVCEASVLMILSVYLPCLIVVVCLAAVILYRRDPW